MILMPFGVLAGVAVRKTGSYRPLLWFAWALLMVSMGFFTIVKEDSPVSWPIGFFAIFSPGIGILTSVAYFPVLAPSTLASKNMVSLLLKQDCSTVPVEQNAYALAFFMFLRNFAQVCFSTFIGQPPRSLTAFRYGASVSADRSFKMSSARGCLLNCLLASRAVRPSRTPLSRSSKTCPSRCVRRSERRLRTALPWCGKCSLALRQ